MPLKTQFTKLISVVILPQDYARLQDQFKSSICKSFSEFIRDILCHRPIAIKYRNQSADDFLLVALDLKHALEEALAAVKLQNLACEPALSSLQQQVAEIRLRMDQIYQLWLSKSPAPQAFTMH